MQNQQISKILIQEMFKIKNGPFTVVKDDRNGDKILLERGKSVAAHAKTLLELRRAISLWRSAQMCRTILTVWERY